MSFTATIRLHDPGDARRRLWLRDTDLSADIQALFRKMAYRRDQALDLSDLRTLLNHAGSARPPKERRHS